MIIVIDRWVERECAISNLTTTWGGGTNSVNRSLKWLSSRITLYAPETETRSSQEARETKSLARALYVHAVMCKSAEYQPFVSWQSFLQIRTSADRPITEHRMLCCFKVLKQNKIPTPRKLSDFKFLMQTGNQLELCLKCRQDHRTLSFRKEGEFLD